MTRGVRLDRTVDDEPVSGKAPIREHVLIHTLPIPLIDDVLIAYLREMYRPRLGADLDLRAYDRQVGQQELIEGLERLRADQQQD
jgi:hypothetical protein